MQTKDRKLARKIADSLEDAGRGALSEREIALFVEKVCDTRSRKAVSKVFADIFRAVAGREIWTGSLRAFIESWLGQKRGELAPQSFLRYEQVAREFIAAIGSSADRDVTSFSLRDDSLILAFRNQIAARLSASSVNVMLKIVRQMFKAAAQRFKIENPASLVGGVRNRDAASGGRRAFTLPEIGRILREVRETEWEGLVLAGLYTGQRLSDLATLRWENIDLVNSELAITTRKTNRRMLIPLAGPLADYLETLPAADDGRAFVFPIAAGFVQRCKAEQTVTLSNQFYEILAHAGLVRRRTHAKSVRGQGRSVRRQATEVSFHSFRHTATSLLKNAGVPQSVVMDIIGHESRAVSQLYTHVGAAEKRHAVDALPSLPTLMAAVAKSGVPSRAKATRKRKG